LTGKRRRGPTSAAPDRVPGDTLHAAIAPDWPTGIALGAGGLAGAYTAARLQSRFHDLLIRRVLGVLVIAIGARYLWAGLAA
jgi:uncharacterized membrane protein YfcA